MEDEIWTTKDGREIAVGDMTENHVRNTLRMIIKNHRRQIEQQEDAASYVPWEQS